MTLADFSDQIISPFPDTTSNMMLYSEQEVDTSSSSPARKLRPIRGAGSSTTTSDNNNNNNNSQVAPPPPPPLQNSWPVDAADISNPYLSSQTPLLDWDIVAKKLEEMGYQCSKESIKEICKENKDGIPTPDSVELANTLVALQTSSTDFAASSGHYNDDNDEVNNPTDKNNGLLDKEEEELGDKVGFVERLSKKRKRNTCTEIELFLLSMVDKVMEKQEEMHRKLIEVVDRHERERIAREEAWRKCEMERQKRDKEMREQEASRHLALISYLEKMLGQTIKAPLFPETPHVEKDKGGKRVKTEYVFDSMTKRWPMPEVQALIRLRMEMANRFRTSDSKISIWEEISQQMASMGYTRDAKKCKEKWENMNKYYKTKLASGNKQPKGAKGCPYYQELDNLYRNRLLDSGCTPVEMKNDGGCCQQIANTKAHVGDCFSMSETLKLEESSVLYSR